MMKHIARILLCALLLTSVLLCACGNVSEEYKYELIFEDDALVLKQDDKELDCWPVEDLFAISGPYNWGIGFATAQGDEEIRAIFKHVFSKGVKLSLTTGDVVKYDENNPVMTSMFGLTAVYCPELQDLLLWESDSNWPKLEARFYVIGFRKQGSNEHNPFVFVDRNGNYYIANSNDEVGARLADFIWGNYCNHRMTLEE